ncbi:General transcription factor II-I repeat domain-containing protein 2 [Eumeta japonica]|uniref:General transcription factor II-I repeat domain-containing protein 2 n=1 Tax=Eumeta variegata TaxID=151549 RepID=A0A4C1T6W0_EUMVA|nr:General transcription factor II-I repeat domain-containing protein 2 [Eumeta japonica]
MARTLVQFYLSYRALDEGTDLSDTAQLALFTRGVNKEFTVTEELLVLQTLKGTTAGEDIFNGKPSFGLPWSKLFGASSSGVSVLGCYRPSARMNLAVARIMLNLLLAVADEPLTRGRPSFKWRLIVVSDHASPPSTANSGISRAAFVAPAIQSDEIFPFAAVAR